MRFSINSRDPLTSLWVLKNPEVIKPTIEDYPAHEEWLKKLPGEFKLGRKAAQLACDGGSPVGALVYNTELLDGEWCEVKNISVLPHYRRLGAATAMLGRFEAEASTYLGASGGVVDTKCENEGVIKFFEKWGYEITKETNLYDSGKPDVVLSRRF